MGSWWDTNKGARLIVGRNRKRKKKKKKPWVLIGSCVTSCTN